jgi:hypothetical protein
MFCRFCGKPVKDKAVVCAGCGRPVDTPGAVVDPSQRWPFGRLLFLISLTIFIPFFGPFIGLGFGLSGVGNENKKTQAAVLLTVSVFMALLTLAIVLGL